jgi:hypothetical protein
MLARSGWRQMVHDRGISTYISRTSAGRGGPAYTPAQDKLAQRPTPTAGPSATPGAAGGPTRPRRDEVGRAAAHPEIWKGQAPAQSQT